MPSYSTSMNKQISPAVTFTINPSQKFPLKALYIEAFDEYFSEVTFEEEKLTLLESLNSLLTHNPRLICFFSLPQSQINECLILTRSYLGKDTVLEKHLIQQLNQNFGRHEFLMACQKNAIDTVHIGGVYGRACVWDCARSMADNIYAKQLGDKHPNIRYKDTAESYQFPNAIIFEDVTEGYISSEITLNELVCFPSTHLFHVNLGQDTDISTKGEAQNPGKVGENYELFSSVDDETLPAYYTLHQHIQDRLVANQVLNLKHMFWGGGEMTDVTKLDENSSTYQLNS